MINVEEVGSLDSLKLKNQRPTVAEIDSASIVHNLNEIKKCLSANTKVMAIVKSNSYGHGIKIVPNILADAGVTHFGVAIVEEGVSLRQSDIEGDILVLGGVYPDQLDEVIEYNLTPVVFNIENAKKLNSYFESKDIIVKVHLKIDTGMGRVGVTEDNFLEFFDVISECKNLEVEGLMSHFAESELEDKTFTKEQLEKFNSAVSLLKKAGIEPKYLHHSNSAATVGFKDSEFNMVRPGIMLYGAYPQGEGVEDYSKQINLKPSMTLKTKILDLKKLKTGETVSYGRTFTCKKDSTIALLPIGYGDGLKRGLSNIGNVLVGGVKCPIAGRVCMDLTMVDVSEVPETKVGDEVIIIGSQNSETIRAEEMADLLDTISYDIFCSLTDRVVRVVK